jgi:hypothetical protein
MLTYFALVVWWDMLTVSIESVTHVDFLFHFYVILNFFASYPVEGAIGRYASGYLCFVWSGCDWTYYRNSRRLYWWPPWVRNYALRRQVLNRPGGDGAIPWKGFRRRRLHETLFNLGSGGVLISEDEPIQYRRRHIIRRKTDKERRYIRSLARSQSAR